MEKQYDLIIVGGGAAGIFASLQYKARRPSSTVLVLEKTAQLLAKVRISGGGRCNVTHHCFDPKELVENYPRGSKELLGPFHHFGPQDTIDWFAERGVQLKTEKDGRMFPTTNSSTTIIETLLLEAKKTGVEIALQKKIETLDHTFNLKLKSGETLSTNRLLLATGSSPQGYAFAKQLGHTLIPPVPSLFTFNVPTSPLKTLSGIAVPKAQVRVGPYTQTGPLLITHFGFSGPAILKLSAFAARYLASKNYRDKLIIDWPPTLPKRLAKALNGASQTCYQIEGKTTNKEEFVTCGGISLPEVNFKNMESRCCPGLHFAGEILNIDGVTGGFNFQNAWTTATLATS